jgi:hypothetical protein
LGFYRQPSEPGVRFSFVTSRHQKLLTSPGKDCQPRMC